METDPQTQKTNLWLPEGKEGIGINWDVGLTDNTLPYVKQVNNKDLLYSTGNYIQNLVINYNGKE